MIQNLEASSEKEMLTEWALAEVHHLQGMVPDDLIARVTADPRAPLTADDRKYLQNAIRGRRFPMLHDLLPLGLKWYRGDFAVGDLGDVMFHWKNPAFAAATPSRRLADLAANADKITDTAFVQRLRRTRFEFDPTQMRGKPILVALNLEGPFLLIEGTTRSLTILLEGSTGRPTLEQLPICVGVGDRLRDYSQYS
jgi:hypothetical protein